MFAINHCFFVILGLFIVTEPLNGLKAGDFFQICKRDDPNLNECIKNGINKARPSLKSGIKELKIPPLEPMVIPEVTLFRGTGPVSLDSKFTNLKVHGITNYKIRQVRADLENNVITLDVETPSLFIESDYEIKGRMLVLPIAGKGDSYSNYTEVSGPMKLEFSPEEKNGNKYLTLKMVKFDSSVKRAMIHMNNLFNGNKELGDAMNNFMSTNWEVVYKEMKPVVDEAIAAILTNVGKKVFERFTYDELFPL